MIKIMFVCHGNICRSPMAEFIFKDIIRKNGTEDKFMVSSSATSSEEIRNNIGNPIFPSAKLELAKHGISCRGKRAVLLRKEDYDKYDMFIGMDSYNVYNMSALFNGDIQNKIHKLMSFTGKNTDVSDPWYSNRFDVAYRDIYDGCCALYVFCKKHNFQL